MKFDQHLFPEWALPRLKEEPHGRVVERCMIHAPVVLEDEAKILEFGSCANQR